MVFASSNEENYNVKLVDVTGRIVLNDSHTAAIGDNQIEINLTAVAPGIYFIIMENGQQIMKSKLIVQ